MVYQQREVVILKPRDTRVHVIRIPIAISDELQKQKKGSFNKIVNELLKKHIEQDKQEKDKKIG